jgi:hypothetical protein
MSLVAIEIDLSNDGKRDIIVKVLENPFLKHLTELFLTFAEGTALGICPGTDRYLPPIGAVFKFLVDGLFHRFLKVSCKHRVFLL